MIPDARFALIPGAAHITPWDAPDTTVGVVRDFLRGADRKLLARR
jgi:pimeloyl-ACP methyl ester carboxylesterase